MEWRFKRKKIGMTYRRYKTNIIKKIDRIDLEERQQQQQRKCCVLFVDVFVAHTYLCE